VEDINPFAATLLTRCQQFNAGGKAIATANENYRTSASGVNFTPALLSSHYHCIAVLMVNFTHVLLSSH
jgi:hypothetical protein